MKIGVIGDIHANLAAFQATLTKLEDEGCDAIVCTGDIVGYGPSPGECVRIVREREIPCVLGNHDQYVTLLMDPRLDRLSPNIRHCVEWTQNKLDMEDLKWLAQLPRQVDFEQLSLVHGSFGPKQWAYLTSAKAVSENFEHQSGQLAFCGHTHIPLLAYFVDDETPPVLSYLTKSKLPDSSKVLINPGSVGQPRDHDPRASCGIYNTESKSVHVARAAYDIEETQALMREANLPEQFITRLSEGR